MDHNGIDPTNSHPRLNPRNPFNWIRLAHSLWLHLGDWYRKKLPWEPVDLYPRLAAGVRFRRRPVLLPSLLFFLLVLLPLGLYRWGHHWGYQPPPPLVLLTSLLPPFTLLADAAPQLPAVFLPLLEFQPGPLPRSSPPILFRRSYRWLTIPTYAYGYWTGSLSSLLSGSVQLNWVPLTPGFLALPLGLVLLFAAGERYLRSQAPFPLWDQLFAWPHIRYATEITPLSNTQPVRWYLYHQRLQLRDWFIAEQQWDLSFEPDNTWSPEQWRKLEVGITAGCYPGYVLLWLLWLPYRLLFFPFVLLLYPLRLLYLLDREYSRLLPSLVWLLGASYRGVLRLAIPPLNPLAGYLYPHLRDRWEFFNTYYWAHWWDQFIYEPAYEFLIKAEIRMDFLDGEWLPEEQEADGWWLRMVRNRRYTFPAFRFLLSRSFWTPYQPLFLPLTYPLGLLYGWLIRPLLLVPLLIPLNRLIHQIRLAALRHPPFLLFFYSPPAYLLTLGPVQTHWTPRQHAFERWVRRNRLALKTWFWTRFLPGWFLRVSPRLLLLRTVVLPWSLAPLALLVLATPLAPLFAAQLPYKPHGTELLLIIVLGSLFLRSLPPLRRWSYWDLRWLLPFGLVAVMFAQNGLWPPRLWTPEFWGLRFLAWLGVVPLPWLLTCAKPLVVLPFTLPLLLHDTLVPPLELFLVDLGVLGGSLVRLIGWWLYHPWGWLLGLLWDWVIWPPLATPWYHLDLWYYYSLKPALLLAERWLWWLFQLGFWALCQLLVLPLRFYWQFPDFPWVQSGPWLHHLLLEGWCPFPKLTNPNPPSPPFWGPGWVLPPILTNPRLLPRFPWPPPF